MYHKIVLFSLLFVNILFASKGDYSCNVERGKCKNSQEFFSVTLKKAKHNAMVVFKEEKACDGVKEEDINCTCLVLDSNGSQALEQNITIIDKDLNDHDITFYPQKEHVLVDILYGTDRGLDAKAQLEKRYDTTRSSLTLGVAQVSVPNTHQFGEVERPGFWTKVFGGDEKIGRDVVITKLETLKLNKFSEILELKLRNVSESDILIFIHGFNVTFTDAIRQTAQLTYDLNFLGTSLTYSWPSQGSSLPNRYMEDEESIKYTNPHLVSFLEEVIRHRGNANIHILAHSMGTRAVSNAIKEISFKNATPQFKNIILAAPDIDADVFRVNIYPYLKKMSEKITIYASSGDSALGISKSLHGGNSRLGQGGKEISVFKDVVMVDATGIDTSMIGHSYFAEKEMLIKDLRAVVQKSLPPKKRSNLIEKLKHKILYWKFDVPEIVESQAGDVFSEDVEEI